MFKNMNISKRQLFNLAAQTLATCAAIKTLPAESSLLVQVLMPAVAFAGSGLMLNTAELLFDDIKRDFDEMKKFHKNQDESKPTPSSS